jgi:peptidoglycan/xylan/chitin deacetylase (PgdA/CDA1 family)
MTAAERWLGRLLGAAGAAGDAFSAPRLSVLIFHRVLPQVDPMFPGEMDARRFDSLLALLAQSFRVFTLGHALALQNEGRLPKRALSITFDDGYADNAQVALPLLQRHRLPATFFVSTGFLDGGRMWNDSVIETLRRCDHAEIDLASWGGAKAPLGGPEARRAAAEQLLSKIKYLSLAEREEALATLHAAAGAPALPDNLMMRSDEVLQLHRAGMEIGGHTVRHPILSVLPDHEAEEEIVQGRLALQGITGAPVEVFAYPNGRPGKDYDMRHVAMVRRLGFKAAVSTASGVATVASDRFQLPRFTPWDRSPVRWAGRLLHQRLVGAQPLLAH